MNRRKMFKFILYVAGDAQNSTQARVNLAAFCRAHLPGRHETEVVDVFRDPRRARADGIFMTPTLVKLTPTPVKRIVGNLSQDEVLLQAFGLEEAIS